jgi:hypothetical protein
MRGEIDETYLRENFGNPDAGCASNGWSIKKETKGLQVLRDRANHAAFCGTGNLILLKIRGGQLTVSDSTGL